jgi:putative ABC transport system substrate-binding protein
MNRKSGHIRAGLRLRVGADTPSHSTRRAFLIAVGAGVLAPWPARAQPADRLRRVGVLMNRPASDRDAQASFAVFKQGLEKLGWTDGRNLRLDHRWGTADAKTLQPAAAELVGLNPEVILASATDGLAALRQETRTIPIVFVSVSDPVGQGLVASLARPGGNLTGFTAFEFSMGGKWMQLLKDIAPRVTRVAVVFNPVTAPYYASFLDSMEAAARSLAVEMIAVPVRDPAGIEGAVTAALGRKSQGGLIAPSDAFTSTHRAQVIALAARHRLPAIYAFRFFPAEGGLMSYGIDRTDLYRRAAPYVDRILRGENPGGMPVQQPTKFELVINIKTAKAIGITIPQSIMLQATRVIE